MRIASTRGRYRYPATKFPRNASLSGTTQDLDGSAIEMRSDEHSTEDSTTVQTLSMRQIAEGTVAAVGCALLAGSCLVPVHLNQKYMPQALAHTDTHRHT